MFYPNQLVLIPKDFADKNKSRFIKMDGTSIDRNIIPKELEESNIFECVNDDNSCIPYYNKNSKIYSVIGENTVNEHYAFTDDNNCMSTAIPGECSVALLLKNKNRKLTFTGVDISINEDTFNKYGIYPKEIQVFGYDGFDWIPLTGVTVIRDIDTDTNSPELIKLSWSHKVNQTIPCNGFKLVISKWSKLIVNVNPGIRNVRFGFKEDKNTVRTISIDCPENYVYCFDLSSYLKINVNNNECALENKIVNLIKKHIKLPEIVETDEETENYVADLSNFYNKHIKDFNDRLEKLEYQENYDEVKIIEVSNNDKNNEHKCKRVGFQEIITVGNNSPDAVVSIILPDNPKDGDAIKIMALRSDLGLTHVKTGEKYKACLAISGNMGSGSSITLNKYGSSIRLVFFKNLWLGVIT